MGQREVSIRLPTIESLLRRKAGQRLVTTAVDRVSEAPDLNRYTRWDQKRRGFQVYEAIECTIVKMTQNVGFIRDR